MRNAYKIMIENSEGKIPLWRPSCRWEDNIRMDLEETGWEGVDWINLAQYRGQWQGLVINLRVP